MEKVWATRVHLHRADPADLTALLSLDDADRLLTSTAIRTPSVRVVKDGTVLPESAYTRRGASLAGKPLTGLVDPRRTLGLFDEGATVVLQGLHRYWPPLTDLVAELELELGHPCQANAYLTPPGSQGFAAHCDSHDVFVLQTHGSKTWLVEVDGEEREIVLEPGLAMYLPTGTRHAARTQQAASLHITLGLNQLTWRDLVERSVRGVLAEVDGDHLPAGYLDDPSFLAAGLAERLTDLAARVQAVDAHTAVAEAAEHFVSSRGTRLRGGVRDLLAVDALEDTTVLRRRPGHPCVLVDAGESVRLLIGDRELRLPARVRPALEVVVAQRELRPTDLAGHLDVGGRLVLCRRLVREGLLEVHG
ncbi:cupin domain-containing protein [Nocardioides sp.]|uniref:cupin domain-containing protein n=1 Tax=Nocardioides sp. TaxID=35761 RepID=UPI0027338DF1|nr:cupin domain-containing protein [Nocardioides sp.]MDP3893853.1 cupin domain-containing protein [Nocardioides sp.]